jgi:glyoxylase-like metal-dependent hydrolase (beta-lactamase superfamily II)
MDVVTLPAFNPGAYTGPGGNNTFLIHGAEPALVDAGVGDPRHLEALAEALGGRALARVLVTHGHSDHASGVAAIAEQWPSVEFMKVRSTGGDERYDVPWTFVADGDLVRAGGRTLRVLHTPGHAPDHACFFDEESGVLFSGDLAVAGTTVVIPGSRGGSVRDYLASLERVLLLSPSKLFPGHGPAIDQPATLLRNYIEHRHEREQQVLEALGRGLSTPAQIVAVLYEGLVEALKGAAEESVLAHLLKLEEDGQTIRVDGRWSLS